MNVPAQRGTVVAGVTVGLLMGSAFGAAQAYAQSAPLKVDTGDTAWVLISSAFVLAMLVPGLALFYGGLVRSKNVLGTIMQSMIILSVVSVLWILVGYSLAFGPDQGGMIGGLDWIGLRGVGGRTASGLCPNYSAPGLYVVSIDVRGHLTRLDYRRLRGA